MDSVPDIGMLLYRMAMDFCGRVAAQGSEKPLSAIVRVCRDYLLAHLHTRIRLDDLADLTGVGTRSLSMQFRREMGLGIMEFLHRERLRESRYLLAHTTLSGRWRFTC